MTRRRLRLLGLVVAFAVLGAGVWLFLTRTAITRENFEMIQVGTTLAEVETILGGPERDESTGPLLAVLPEDYPVTGMPGKKRGRSSFRIDGDNHAGLWKRAASCSVENLESFAAAIPSNRV
jgi:hypothetical protein